MREGSNPARPALPASGYRWRVPGEARITPAPRAGGGSWQITPRMPGEAIIARGAAVAMNSMREIDIATIETARRG